MGIRAPCADRGEDRPLQCRSLSAMCSCLGQIPLDDVDKQSSSSGVTWMPTSTGLDAFFISMGEGEGGLSTPFSKQRLPLHCFRLCSIKIRMSPNGKFIWHCPQVRRSWSPSGAPNGPWSGSSSVRMASRGSGENSRLLKCWGLPCLRRDMVGCGAGGRRRRRRADDGSVHIGRAGLERRRLQRKYLHQCLLTSKIN